MKQLLYNHCEWLLPLWFVIIFLLCASPGSYFPSADWLELLSFDKWVHAGIFFGLNTLCWLLILKKEKSTKYIYLSTLLCILYGVILEVMQARVFTERAYDEMDMIANAAGSVMVFPLRKKLVSGIKL